MTEITDDERQRIIDALYAGRKIDAIKIYRQANNSDLLTAKTFIEQLETRLRAETPESFTAAQSKGCSGAGALIFIVLVSLMGGALGAYCALRPPGQLPAMAAPHAAANAVAPR
jgi:hypothetical protein